MKRICPIKKYAVMLLLSISFFTITCKKEVHVTSVTLHPSAASLTVGSSLALDAAVEPADASNKTLAWSTDHPNVATINSAGEITAVAPGTAKVTVTTEDGGFLATCNVTVKEATVPVTGVTITCPEEILLVGNTLKLEASVEPAEATNKTVTWSIDDEQIAKINSVGELTAIAPGTAKITVTTEDGEFTAICNLTIEEENLLVPVTGVNIICPESILLVGNTLKLEAAVEPAEAANKTVTWSSDNEQIATINSAGELTAISPGTAIITVITEDGGFKGICTVTVETPVIVVTGVTIKPPTALLLVGNSLKLETIVEPAEATNKTVTWTTSDDRIVTVNSAGELTAVAPGTANITVTTDDGGFKESCTITVSATGIIMTTMAYEVMISISTGTSVVNPPENVIIDWGDGKQSNMDDHLKSLYGTKSMGGGPSLDWYTFSHSYSSAPPHTITITGDKITVLECGYYLRENHITGIDLSRFPALKGLICFNNQLTSLDVSHNSALTTLYCDGNQLTDLDVSRNAALKGLGCSNNQLTTLEVSRNTDLTTLSCGNNILTVLDVSQNTVLERLGCSNNQLTTLNLSRNTVLTDLDCNNNQLNTLNLGSNVDRMDMLHCRNNQFTTLDLSSLAWIKFFDCSYNQLKTLDLNKTMVGKLACSHNQLTTLHVSGESEREVDCSYNQLTASALNDFFRSLRDDAYGQPWFIISISGNPGAGDCDISIAENKGYEVVR